MCANGTRRWQWIAAFTILYLMVASCQSWRPREEPLTEVLAEKGRTVTRIKVTDIHGVQTELDSPRIVRDSLVGFGPRTQAGVRERLAVAQSDIGTIEVQESSTPKTIAAVAAVGGGAFLVLSFILLSTW